MTQLETSATEQHELAHNIESTRTLLKASVFALIFAALVLTLVILPAEYNIDPTGLGERMGLVQLASPVVANEPIVANESMEVAEEADAGEFHEDDAVISIPAGVGLEYKYSALKDESVRYSWTSDGELFFDFHGEPEGDTTGYFQSYTVSTSNNVRGSLTAPFAGTHGWYWENKTTSPITVSIHIEGNYELIGLK